MSSLGSAPGNEGFWLNAIGGMLGAIESGGTPIEHINPAKVGSFVLLLLRDGGLANLGDLQAFLVKRKSPVQLTAMPIAECPLPEGLCAVDPITTESKSHWLKITVDVIGDESKQQRALAGLTQEDNIERLRTDTGFPAPANVTSVWN